MPQHSTVTLVVDDVDIRIQPIKNDFCWHHCWKS